MFRRLGTSGHASRSIDDDHDGRVSQTHRFHAVLSFVGSHDHVRYVDHRPLRSTPPSILSFSLNAAQPHHPPPSRTAHAPAASLSSVVTDALTARAVNLRCR